MPCPIPEINLEINKIVKLVEKPVSKIPHALINGPMISKGLLPILSVKIPIGKLNNNLANAKIETANPIERILTFNSFANMGKIGEITPCPDEMRAVAMHSISS